MFDKLKNNIFSSIFWLCLVFAVAVSAISYVVIVSNLYNTQKAKSVSNCNSAAKMASTYLLQVMSFVENTASRSALAQAASGGEHDATQELNQLCNYSIKIDGATLYGYDGHMIYSSELGAPPALEELKREADILAFLEGEGQTHVSVRVTHVAGVYNRTYYNSANGVISCMAKIYKDGIACGVLVADVLPETLFSQRMRYSSFDMPCYFVIRVGNTVFSADESVKQLITEGSRNYYMASGGLTDDSSIQMYVSKENFARQCLVIGGAMAAVLMVLLCTIYHMANKISRNAVAPLEKLNQQMNLTNLP